MEGKKRTPTVGYMRVSTEKQADKGTSLESQRQAIEQYAALYDLEIVEWVEDAGYSAKSLRRPGVKKALRMLDDGRADALVVAKLDRLTRSLRDLGNLLDNYFREDKALLSVSENVDTRTATGRMVLNVITTISQWEREQVSERVATMHATKRARKERVGRPPYGMRVDGRHLVPNDREQEVLRTIRKLRKSNTSIRGIAEHLNTNDVPARGKKWHANTIARILAR